MMTAELTIPGLVPLFEDGRLAAAEAALRLFIRSLGLDRSEEIRDVFLLLWLRLDAAAEEGNVAVIADISDFAPSTAELISRFAENEAESRRSALPCIVGRSDYELLCAAGAAVMPEEINDVDTFRQFIPFVREPLDESHERLYFTRRYREEFHVADDIARRLMNPSAVQALPERLTELLKIEEANPNRNAEQLDAVVNAVKSPFAVITGGPGTGKTTSVANLLSVFLSADPEVRRPIIALAAQTGKAAARMTESLVSSASGKGASAERRAFLQPLAEELACGRIEAKTIDRWLVTPTMSGERPSKDHPLDAELLVLDEASMIDLTLAYRLFSVLSPKARVILLGDANQLAAVGPGAVFAELCLARMPEGMPPMVSRLVKSWRFPAESAIGRISDAICRGDADLLLGTCPGRLSGMMEPAVPLKADTFQEITKKRSAGDIQADACILKAEDSLRSELPHEVTDWLVGRMAPYIEAVRLLLKAHFEEGDTGPESELWRRVAEALRHFRFLCAARKGLFGVNGINRFAVMTMLDALSESLSLNSKAEEIFTASVRRAKKSRLNDDPDRNAQSDPVAFPGEVIMVTQNDAGADVFNGDIAVVLPDAKGEPSTARLLESGRDVPLVLLPAYETAFAMTIHKSQGSEFGTVGVFMPDRPDSPLAARELLYTGVTRAKENARIFSTLPVLRRSVLTAVDRTGGLGDRLTERLQVHKPS